MTLSLARHAFFSLAVSSAFSGCPATTPVDDGPGNGILEPESGPDGSIIRRFDLDGDGKANLWRVIVQEPDPADGSRTIDRVLRIDLDLNFDGKADTRRFLDAAGETEREEVDLDYDGKIDAVAKFERGRKVREDVFLSHRANPDVVRLYADGKVVEKRRDTDADGKFDVFEYFDSGRLVRVGRDTTGDGEPDRFDESVEPEEVPQGEKGTGKPEGGADGGG